MRDDADLRIAARRGFVIVPMPGAAPVTLSGRVIRYGVDYESTSRRADIAALLGVAGEVEIEGRARAEFSPVVDDKR